MLKHIVMLLLCCIQIYAVNLKLLNGTTVHLSESQLHNALFRGVPFAEGLSENLYNLSFKNLKQMIEQIIKQRIAWKRRPVDELEKIAIDDLKQYLGTIKELATSRLIGLMFHRAGGQFQLTSGANNPIRPLSAKHIGGLLRIISESESLGQDRLKSAISIYLNGLQLENNETKQVFKPKDWNPFINALLNSLTECNPNNPNAMYAPGTTHGILIGYALRRCYTKVDLEEYLSSLTGRDVELSDQEYTNTDITRILAQGVDLTDPVKFADWLICAFYEKNYQAGLPKISSNTMVTFDGESFPDCVESTLLNLVNIATFAQGRLGVAPEGITFSPELQQFYSFERSQKASEVENKAVHQEWTKVVENIPGIAYNRIKISGRRSISLPNEYEGFMPIDDSMISPQELAVLPEKTINIENQNFILHEKTVGNAKYLLVSPDSNLVCLEVMPTASNIVVVLNKVFDLNLYAPNAMFDPHFSKNNFSQICTKLGWKSDSSKIDNTQDIVINVSKEQSSFDISLHRKAHGHITVVKDNVTNYLSDSVLTQALYQQHPQEISEMVVLSNASLSMQQLYEVAGHDGVKFLHLLRNIDVRNIDRCLDVVLQTLQLNIQNTVVDGYVAGLIVSSLSHDLHYLNSIARIEIIKDVSDIIKNSLKLVCNIELIQQGFSSSFFNVLEDLVIAGIYSKSELFLFLNRGMASNYSIVQSSVLNIIRKLVEHKIVTDNDKSQLLDLLQKSIGSEGNNDANTFHARACQSLPMIVSLVENKIVTGNDKIELLDILQKIMTRTFVISYYDNPETVRLIFDNIVSLAENKIVNEHDKSQLLDLIQKGIKQEWVSGDSFFKVINSLIENKILTKNDNIELLELLTKDMDYDKFSSILRAVVQGRILTIQDKVQLLGLLEKFSLRPISLILSYLTTLVIHDILTQEDKAKLWLWIEAGISKYGNGMADRLALDLMKNSVAKNIWQKNEMLQLVNDLKNRQRISPEVAMVMVQEISSIPASLNENIQSKIASSPGMFNITQPKLMRHIPQDVLPSDQDLEDIAKRVGISSDNTGNFATGKSLFDVYEKPYESTVTHVSGDSTTGVLKSAASVASDLQRRTNLFESDQEPDELPEGTAGSGARSISRDMNSVSKLSTQKDMTSRLQKSSSNRGIDISSDDMGGFAPGKSVFDLYEQRYGRSVIAAFADGITGRLGSAVLDLPRRTNRFGYEYEQTPNMYRSSITNRTRDMYPMPKWFTQQNITRNFQDSLPPLRSVGAMNDETILARQRQLHVPKYYNPNIFQEPKHIAKTMSKNFVDTAKRAAIRSVIK